MAHRAIVLAGLLAGCGGGWKNVPPPAPPPARVPAAALVPDTAYVLPELPPPPPPRPWPRGELLVVDRSPVPVLPTRSPGVVAASKLVLEETWSGMGGSGFRRVTLTRDGRPGLAFVAEGSRSRYGGATTIVRTGRIADDRVRRVTARVAALGRASTGPVRKDGPPCVVPACSGTGALTVQATTTDGRTEAFTRTTSPCDPGWMHHGERMTVDVPGIDAALREVLSLTVDAAVPTEGETEVRFADGGNDSPDVRRSM